MPEEQSDSEKYETVLKPIVDSMMGRPLAEVVSAISQLAKGVTVTDDGEMPMVGHTKTKMTISYPDGSKGTVVMRTARSQYNGPT